MAKPKVFISEPIHQKGLELLDDIVEIVEAPDTSKKTVLSLIKDCQAAILRATTQFDAEVINTARNLRIIARTGVGYNNVDLAAASNRGIYVTLTPGANTTTVAEHVLTMILTLGKQVFFMDLAVREGQWNNRFSNFQMDVSGKTVGIIGLGAIGQEVARLCDGLGMLVLAYDPFTTDFSGSKRTDNLQDIFRESDFVTLHCPVLPATRHLVNKEYLSMMKTTAYLINSSRGALINETDLVEALQDQRICGAALDVFENEPLRPDHPLAGLSNVILSPHCAGSTVESNERIAVMAAQAVLDTLEGKRPKHICNENHIAAL